ncbi:exopolysaccharide synthesis protein exoD [Xanthomonas arboricola pv. pruni str. MAFF 311562]|uniref:Exopolysaccharide synthesis protein exoD n=1 Tax=Xanthomonas arboricola pv. pruni str. MAFF 311562 TaxID=1414836 RepID=W4S5J6_9XANT|nr:exopolysaccharide synthesis protein exoD [Xanthomonas arboricola pv. pruni str. MAFF 311562]
MISSDNGVPPSDGADGAQMRYRNEGIRSLLAAFSEGDPEHVLRVREILADLQQSAFGVFLFLAILPSFIPIPGVAGGISGPLTVLIGLQMMCCLRKRGCRVSSAIADRAAVPASVSSRGLRRRCNAWTGCSSRACTACWTGFRRRCSPACCWCWSASC